jgi:hypothetical protein
LLTNKKFQILPFDTRIPAHHLNFYFKGTNWFNFAKEIQRLLEREKKKEYLQKKKGKIVFRLITK